MSYFLIRNVHRDRCKHVRTPQALKLRAVALMRVRTTVNCNHRDFQQN